MKEVLGRNIKRARQERKMTQVSLGIKCGLPQHVISRIEKGRHMPRISTLVKIANGLEVDVTQLFYNHILYYFNPNTYGSEYFVMEESKEAALKSLRNFFKEMTKDADYGEFYAEDIDIWSKVDANDPETYPMKYTIEEYGKGHVINSERN